MKKLNDVYESLIYELYKKNEIVDGTKELLNYNFEIDSNDNILEYRHLSLKYILAEMIWYFSGNNDMRFISQFASIWEKLSDNGRTNNSAYGYILKYKSGFDQIETIIDLLKHHRESRRAVLNINSSNIYVKSTKDEPCTIALQFYIRNNKLHATGMMRSNDVWFGLPYDIIFFTELQKYIARKLNIESGNYHHFVTSIHMYMRDEEKIKEVISNYHKDSKKEINIDFEKLIKKSKKLYRLVNKDNILDVCEKEGII